MFRSCILSLLGVIIIATYFGGIPRETDLSYVIPMATCQVPQIVEQKRVQHRHVEQFVAWLWGVFMKLGDANFTIAWIRFFLGKTLILGVFEVIRAWNMFMAEGFLGTT